MLPRTSNYCQYIHDFLSQIEIQVKKTSIEFNVETKVHQGCVMSSALFVIAIDLVMKNTISDIPIGIRWNTFGTTKDLNFADDSVIHSFTHTIRLYTKPAGSTNIHETLD